MVALAPDILVLNNRGPKPGILTDQTTENFEEALTLHFRTPHGVLPGMKERGWGRIVCITSAMVTAPEEVQIASAKCARGADGVDEGGVVRRRGTRSHDQLPAAAAGFESQRQHYVC